MLTNSCRACLISLMRPEDKVSLFEPYKRIYHLATMIYNVIQIKVPRNAIEIR